MVLQKLHLALTPPRERRERAQVTRRDLGPRAPVAPKAPASRKVATRAGVLEVLEKAKENNRIRMSVMPFRKEHVLWGERLWIRSHQGTWAVSNSSPSRKMPKSSLHASGNCRFGKDSRDKHTARSPSPGGKREEQWNEGKVETNLPPHRRPLPQQFPQCAAVSLKRYRVV